MINLTDRQIQILKAIIKEYMETALPVGSEILDKKYNLGISPATIRNEMVILGKNGFLKQPHTSAGRMPTPMALKFYVQQLMEEKDLSVAEEVAVKGKIWDYKDKLDKLFYGAAKILSEKLNALAVITTKEGDIYHFGSANILEDPEFFDIDVAKTILGIIDDFDSVNKIFSRALSEEPIHILLGDEIGVQSLESCGFVFTNFKTQKTNGFLGIVGSCRLNYSTVIPTLRYFHNLIEEIGKKW